MIAYLVCMKRFSRWNSLVNHKNIFEASNFQWFSDEFLHLNDWTLLELFGSSILKLLRSLSPAYTALLFQLLGSIEVKTALKYRVSFMKVVQVFSIFNDFPQSGDDQDNSRNTFSNLSPHSTLTANAASYFFVIGNSSEYSFLHSLVLIPSSVMLTAWSHKGLSGVISRTRGHK